MEFEELKCLICLAQKQDWALAAQACGLSESALLLAIRAIEVEYQQPIVKPAYPFQGFTDEGERVLEHAREFCFASEEAKRSYTEAKRRSFVAPLLERRSVSPKRLCAPGPSAHDIGLIAQAGLHAPDHGSLHPWRLLEFHADQRAALADCFEAEKRRRDPLAPAKDLQHARDHALRPPVLLAFIVSPKARTKVPVREQWLAAGAALGGMLNAAHQLGFGAIVLSGERCFDPELEAALGIGSSEFLAGFLSFGSVSEAPPARKHPSPDTVLSRWLPASGADHPQRMADLAEPGQQMAREFRA